MALLAGAVGLLILCGFAALAARRSFGLSTALGAGGAVAACAVGLAGVVHAVATGTGQALSLPWNMPLGSLAMAVDPLSAFFLVPTLVVSALAALYGAGYLRQSRGTRSVGAHWLSYNLLIAGMVVVVLARNGVLFLLAWEVMSLASFFLVVFEHEQERVRQAGWTYLVASHLGVAFLLALFAVLGREAGTLDFARFHAAGVPMAGLAFVLAVVGFGAKAGFVPFHVWLPEAHPAAPSHVSAVMSGVMIKMGIYGLLRTLTFLGAPAVWWAYVLIVVGLTSGILGVVFALAQHDLKRLLAYHSVENIGIIALGIGVGVLGVSSGSEAVAALGFAGALLHVLNHALFKSLLFLGAGSVLHATGTGEIDRLGGLLKRMPWTGATFLIGAVAICGLPPLNGFVSEFLIYLGAFRGAGSATAPLAVPLLVVIAGLALIGGLATACFTKAFGIVFLGEPRSEMAARGHEAGPRMRVPMVLLAAACVGLGLAGPLVPPAMTPLLAATTGLDPARVVVGLSHATVPLFYITAAALAFMVLLTALAWVRRRLLAGREVGEAGTWDCGYARPTPRMQYTASSFAQPLTEFFRGVLRTRRHEVLPEGTFPDKASLATETPDPFREAFYAPLFRAIESGLSRLRWIQEGRVQVYILYVALTLVLLLLWQLG